MKKQITTLSLGTDPLSKLLPRYAIPAIIAMISTSLFNIIDSIFIGHGVGALAISGMALTMPIMNIASAFGALVGVGITTLFAVQVFLNIGVVTNLIPNTGISLPFFSYGGTALIIQLAEVGVMLSISRQIPAPKQD